MKKITEFRLPKLTRGQKVLRNLIVIAGMCFIMFGVFFGFDKPCRTFDEAIEECLIRDAGMLPPYEITDRYTVFDKLGNGNLEFYHSVAYVKSILNGEDVLIQLNVRLMDSFWDDFIWYKPEYYAYIEKVEPYTEPEYEVRWADIDRESEDSYHTSYFTYWDNEMPDDEITGLWTDQNDQWLIRMSFDYHPEQTSNEDLYFSVKKSDYCVKWLETSEFSKQQRAFLGEKAAVRMAVNLAEDFERKWKIFEEYKASGMYVTDNIAQELVEE